MGVLILAVPLLIAMNLSLYRATETKSVPQNHVSQLRPGFVDNLCKQEKSTVKSIEFGAVNGYTIECANGTRIHVPN